MDPGLENLNSQPQKKAKLSHPGPGQHGSIWCLLISRSRSEGSQQPNNELQITRPSLPEDIVGPLEIARIHSASIASKAQEESKSTPNLRKPSIQSSKPSVTGSRPLLTTTIYA